MYLTLEDVKYVINSWDPIGLLAMHAPSDEYEYEIENIFIQIKESTGVTKIAEIVFNQFAESFGLDVFNCNMSECSRIASEILQQRREL